MSVLNQESNTTRKYQHRVCDICKSPHVDKDQDADLRTNLDPCKRCMRHTLIYNIPWPNRNNILHKGAEEEVVTLADVCVCVYFYVLYLSCLCRIKFLNNVRFPASKPVWSGLNTRLLLVKVLSWTTLTVSLQRKK